MSNLFKINYKYTFLLLILIAVLFNWIYSINKIESTIIDNAHLGTVEAITLFPNEKYFASSGYDYKLKIWNLEDKRHVKTEDLGLHVIKDFAVSDKYDVVYGVGNEGTFFVWDADNHSLLKAFDPLYFPILSIEFSKNDEFLVAYTMESIIIFEVQDWNHLEQPIFVEYIHKKQPRNIFFRDNELISIESNGLIVFWDIHTGELMKKIETGHSIRSADISKNSERILIGYQNSGEKNISSLEFWNLNSGSKESMAAQCNGAVIDILFHNFDNYAIVSCSESPLRKYYTDTSINPQSIWKTFKPGLRMLTYSEKNNSLIYRIGSDIEIIWNFL